ncbi:hypothetical protein [uncultured Draconibacterium sp.]|uniref:hypothetical protein n=1 Tax=uncultured Draconibacterium sp. TaxID=1573823 RepID=UPI0029C66752|nr:hypothetical protein [uncultured Draconibacterium sp.]
MSQFKVYIVFILILFSGNLFAQKQKNIVIDEQLTANSEPLKVKMGSQIMGKMAKYKFGNFEVIEGKTGWQKSDYSSNLFETKVETSTSKKFWFSLADESDNTVTVHAALNVRVKVNEEKELFGGFYVGENEELLNSDNFTATLFFNSDTTKLWLLYMLKERGSESKQTGTAFLTNGSRKILILSATSADGSKDNRMFPALGYEFVEDGQSLSALQYFGGGAMGLNKVFVWLHNELDENTKLLLAGAATAILHNEYSALSDF